jgi:tRNA acetyltransferase TAN1
MWPDVLEGGKSDDPADPEETISDDGDDEIGKLDIESQIAKELAIIQRPRREQLFGTIVFCGIQVPSNEPTANCQTNTPCGVYMTPPKQLRRRMLNNRTVIFISCKPPIDPVRLVAKHVENVQSTRITRTR